MHKIKTLFSDVSGAMAVIVALLLASLMGISALAVDVGRMSWVQYELKKASEAGALAGAAALGSCSNPDWNQAQAMAQSIVQQNTVNGYLLSDCEVVTGYWDLATKTLQPSGIIPNATERPAIQVTIKKNSNENGGPLQFIFAPILGINHSDLQAVSVAIIRPGAGSNPFDYTIFSGSSSATLTLNGSQQVKGSVHANAKLTINGSSDISQVAEGVKGTRINGSNKIGAVRAGNANDISINGNCDIQSPPPSGGAVYIDMPDYTQQIMSTAAQTYSSNKTFNGSVDVDGSIYVDGQVILNGSIDSTGAILASGNITVNGSSSITGDNQVCLYSANGNIIVNGSSAMGTDASAVIYAPNGTVIINGSSNFHGRIVANKIIINGSANVNGDDFPVKTLPIKSHGAALVK
jgi:cytoskeletal protein CcmA (bactofilin family)/Flp pilus assembly protein TadG